MDKKLTYLLLTAVTVPSGAMSCVDIPQADEQLKMYVKDGREYATFEDYGKVNFGLSEYTQLMSFQRIDSNEDGHIDLKEIQADIDSYYVGCRELELF